MLFTLVCYILYTVYTDTHTQDSQIHVCMGTVKCGCVIAWVSRIEISILEFTFIGTNTSTQKRTNANERNIHILEYTGWNCTFAIRKCLCARVCLLQHRLKRRDSMSVYYSENVCINSHMNLFPLKLSLFAQREDLKLFIDEIKGERITNYSSCRLVWMITCNGEIHNK